MRNPESVPHAKQPESWLKPTNSSSFVWHLASCMDMSAEGERGEDATHDQRGTRGARAACDAKLARAAAIRWVKGGFAAGMPATCDACLLLLYSLTNCALLPNTANVKGEGEGG